MAPRVSSIRLPSDYILVKTFADDKIYQLQKVGEGDTVVIAEWKDMEEEPERGEVYRALKGDMGIREFNNWYANGCWEKQ